MDLFEFENKRFGGLWTDEDIKKVRESEPQRHSDCLEIFWGNGEEKYKEFQEANWSEYFDFAKTYRYCLYK